MVQFGSCAAFEDTATAVGEAWLVVEAVREEMKLDLDTFAELNRSAPADCILGLSSSPSRTRLTLGKGANQERRRMICNVRFAMRPDTRTVELTTDGETEPPVSTFLSDLPAECCMLPAAAGKEPAE